MKVIPSDLEAEWEKLKPNFPELKDTKIETKVEIKGGIKILEGNVKQIVGQNPVITIFVSNDVWYSEKYKVLVRMVLIHELCHLINKHKPDKVMEEKFPKMYKVWKMTEKAGALG